MGKRGRQSRATSRGQAAILICGGSQALDAGLRDDLALQ